MNTGAALTHESYFGPPSEFIDLTSFIDSANAVGHEPQIFQYEGLSQDDKSKVESECNIIDVSSHVMDILKDPLLQSHITKSHRATLDVIFDTATSGRRRKRRHNLPDPMDEPAEVTAFQDKLENVPLECWPYLMDAAFFLRTPKNSDPNVLLTPKSLSTDPAPLPSSCEAVITVNIYNRVPWAHNQVSQLSQHILLSSQTLGDIYDSIPCISNEIPQEKHEEDSFRGYEGNAPPFNAGAVLVLEGIAYGDGLNETDYADKLLEVLQRESQQAQPIQKAATSMHDTPLSSLKLRTNEPYWLLHQGNCEHFIVIEQIRLFHESDYASGYPLTTHITPPLLDLCRICSKVPAVLSVIGSLHLGESPFLLCEPCWKNIGEPLDDNVLVIPLPKHEFGW